MADLTKVEGLLEQILSELQKLNDRAERQAATASETTGRADDLINIVMKSLNQTGE